MDSIAKSDEAQSDSMWDNSRSTKKVLIYSPAAGGSKGHAYTYAVNLCNALSDYVSITLYTIAGFKLLLQKNGDVTKFNIIESQKFLRGAINKERFNKYRIFSKLIYGFYRFYYNLELLIEARRTFVKGEFDYFHLLEFEYVSTFLVMLFKPKILKKSILGIHPADFRWIKGRSFIDNSYKVLSGYCLRLLVGKAHKSTVHGNILKKNLLESLSMSSQQDKIVSISYGTNVNVKIFDRNEARRRIGIKLEENERYLGLFFGMIREDKGLDTLLRALPFINLSLKLLIAGSLADITKETLNNWIEHEKVYSRLILRLEYISERDIPLYFSSADIVFLPHKKYHLAYSGPLGLAVSYERPVIGSNVSEIGNYIQRYKIGFVFRPGNYRELAQKTNELIEKLDNPLFLKDLSKKCKIAKRDNSWKNVAKKVYTMCYLEGRGDKLNVQ